METHEYVLCYHKPQSSSAASYWYISMASVIVQYKGDISIPKYAGLVGRTVTESKRRDKERTRRHPALLVEKGHTTPEIGSSSNRTTHLLEGGH